MRSERLDHLGLVAGVCEQIDLQGQVDALIPSERQVSHGQATQAMVLNALGFVSRALYLTPEFFRGKPLDRLIAPGIQADDLNDDALGRTLDALFDAGVTEVFAQIAAKALKCFDITPSSAHLDSTTFSFHGQFASSTSPDQVHAGDDDTPTPVEVTYGYSRDQRPDLKQIVVELICCNRSHLPVWFEALSGNASDQAQFHETINAYLHSLQAAEPPHIIADSALYSRDAIVQLQGALWLTRVPARFKAVKRLYQTYDRDQLPELEDHPGYRALEIDDAPKGQRWLLVASKAAFERESHTLERRIAKELEAAHKSARALKRLRFKCEQDALAAAQRAAKRWPFHDAEFQLESKARYEQRGRPAKAAEPDWVEWRVSDVAIKADDDAIEAKRRTKGKFVLATNDLDTERLPVGQWLSLYKAQSVSVERGFRFLKDPKFFADAMYLKKPERIMAMAMVMTLSLLIYSLAERQLRLALAQRGETIPDQKGQPTSTPTMRRVFQIFEGIEILVIQLADEELCKVLNLSDLHRQILGLMGPILEKIYADSS